MGVTGNVKSEREVHKHLIATSHGKRRCCKRSVVHESQDARS